MTGEAPHAGESEGNAWWVSHRWYLVSGGAAVLLAVALGLIILLRRAPLVVDTGWMAAIIAARHPLLESFALVLDFVGGYWFGRVLVPLAIAMALLLARHRWGAVYFATTIVVNVLVVQLLKNLFDRARPDDILIVIGTGSFPSGHTALAAALAVALGIVFRKRWVWMIGALYVVLMALTRTYLGAHWISDTVAGALVGAGMAVIIWAPFAYRLNQERKQRSAADSARKT